MVRKPEDEIQKKLMELEISIKEDELKQTPALSKEHAGGQLTTTDTALTEGMRTEDVALKADMYTLGGLCLSALSIVMLFSHTNVMSGWGWGAMFGPSRFPIGIFLMPIFLGVGMLFYNYKSRVAQVLSVASIGLLIFLVITQLQMSFAPISLLELLLMVVPLCAGLVLLLKGHYKRIALKGKLE